MSSMKETMSYRIFTDATADLTLEMLQGLPKVEIIPMQVNINDQQYTCGPYGDLPVPVFYNLQRQKHFASTAQINPQSYRDCFARALDQGLDVLYLGFSSGILSSLAELPIRQDLAVTGSVNQRGEIQAIGGVTYKIEGFFELCKKRGLTGTQGVLIPASNVKELVLSDEVVDAVRDGQFHIYPITHIHQGMELLMQRPAGEKDANGEFPAGSIHAMVSAKLKAFAALSGE